MTAAATQKAPRTLPNWAPKPSSRTFPCVAESDQDVLSEIDAALKRIDAGTFGACLSCLEEGKTAAKSLIPKLRLKAIPYAKNCVECERKRENLSP